MPGDIGATPLTRRGVGKRIVAASAVAAATALEAPAAAQTFAGLIAASTTQGGTVAQPGPETIWSFQPVDPNTGPFRWTVGGASFNGRWDPVMYFGFNYEPTGFASHAGEPRAAWVIEADYDDGTKRTVEQYCEIASANDRLRIRPFFFQVKRDATTYETFMTRSSIQGNPFVVTFPDGDGGTEMLLVYKNNIDLKAADPAAPTTIRARAAKGQTAIFGLGFDANTDVLQIYPETSTQSVLRTDGRSILRLYADPHGAPGQSICVGANDSQAVGCFDVSTSDPTIKGLVARGRAGQSGNLLEVQDQTATPLSGFTENGYFFTRTRSEIADSELVAGELALWLDATDGAARLRIKAKQADGTVRTGEVALR
ncbi:MAG: hypothetical protein QOD83_1593 [Solirubrobacteraceae bacterium]|nr:hypothetical protein [Solirubrobacteraceae bacterium]